MFIPPSLRAVSAALGLALVAGLGAAGTASAQTDTLAVYSFTGAAGSEATLPPDAQPTGATASVISRGAGLTPSAAGGVFSSSGFELALTRDATDYVEFGIAPDAGRALTLSALVFDERRSGTGIRTFALYSNLDGYTTPIQVFEVPDDTNTRTQRAVLGTAFTGLTTGVTFRLYGYAAEATAGTWRQDNIKFVGRIGAGGGPVLPVVRFAAASATVAENGGTATLRVRRTGDLSAASTVSLRASGGTATAGSDYTFATQTLTFAAGDTSKTVTVPIVNDTAAEPSETVVIDLETPTGALVGAPSSFTLTITDDDAPTTGAGTIGAARAAAVGSTVTFEGVITRAQGAFSRIQDATGALVLRATSGAFFDAVASGAVEPGDLVRVTGVTSEFNGLFQLNEGGIQTFTVVTRGTPLPAAQTVTLAQLATNGEQYESEIVRVTGLTTTGTGIFAAATTYPVTDASGTLDLRTANAADTDLDGEPVPLGAFTFEGPLSQFKSATTVGGGYQLQPINATDITSTGPAGPTSVAFTSASALTTESAGTYAVSVSILNPDPVNATTVQVVLDGGTATPVSDFSVASPVTLTFAAGSRTPQTVTVTLVTDTVTEPEETILFRLQNVAGGNTASIGTPSTFTLRLADGGATGGGTICPGQNGATLLACLRAGYPRTNPRGYGERTSFYSSYYGPQPYRGVYTGRTGPLGSSGPNEINTEHTWPQSKMPNQGETAGDMHNLYLTIASVNGARGNLPLLDIDDNLTTAWYGPTGDGPRPTTNIDAYSEGTSSAFEPREDHKGNAARAVAYFYTLYGTNDVSFWESSKRVLVTWNTLDPANAEEIARSAAIRAYQGNENPYILDATLMQRAFGTTTSTTLGDRPTAFSATLAGARPVRTSLGVSVSLPSASEVTVDVYDVAGRRVAQTVSNEGAGQATLSLDVAGLPAGVYVARVRAGASATSLTFVHVR